MSSADPAGREPHAEERLDDLARLWAPWRSAYHRGETRGEGCPFCLLTDRSDRESLVVARGETAFVVLNAYPYNPGHVMVVPYRHVDDIAAMTHDEVVEAAELAQRSIVALRAAIGPGGFTVGWNVGRVAGAGIAEHLHQHVVPRWGGDTNLMPIIGGTRVLPELLDDTWARLAPAFAELAT